MDILPENTPEERAASWAKIRAACLALIIVLLVFRNQIQGWLL